jgi:hypothetical protein
MIPVSAHTVLTRYIGTKFRPLPALLQNPGMTWAQWLATSGQYGENSKGRISPDHLNPFTFEKNPGFVLLDFYDGDDLERYFTVFQEDDDKDETKQREPPWRAFAMPMCALTAMVPIVPDIDDEKDPAFLQPRAIDIKTPEEGDAFIERDLSALLVAPTQANEVKKHYEAHKKKKGDKHPERDVLFSFGPAWMQKPATMNKTPYVLPRYAFVAIRSDYAPIDPGTFPQPSTRHAAAVPDEIAEGGAKRTHDVSEHEDTPPRKKARREAERVKPDPDDGSGDEASDAMDLDQAAVKSE